MEVGAEVEKKSELLGVGAMTRRCGGRDDS
jgi:hypothetical protein